MFTSSVDSVLIVVPVPPAGLLRLLALRTIVATVRQYKALAKAFLVELHYWRERVKLRLLETTTY